MLNINRYKIEKMLFYHFNSMKYSSKEIFLFNEFTIQSFS